ncbi:MAG TPA: hypothetical protein VHG10_13735 [Glycomyces sp.]|nr:hypothetical protein [Glycomyces sp.]
MARAHLRADPLPSLPFVIAIVVAAVALVVAIEHRPGTDAATASVSELPSGPPKYDDEGMAAGEDAELEIVEYGFSKVTDAAGKVWLIAGLVVHNPHDRELMPGGFVVTTETPRGYPMQLEQIYLGSLPPRSTASFGHVIYRDVDDIAVEDLELKEMEPATLYPQGAWRDEEWAVDPLPDIEVVATEPLVSPDGYRLHFRSEAAVATDVQLSVLFRDDQGRLLGGIPAASEPFSFDGGSNAYRMQPEGESLQFVDVHESWIPEGADLASVEIGPSH